MDQFEYVFSLIGLLLGLSLVEVLSGLVKARKARSVVRIGWLTPMLGVIVILHVTSFWGMTWNLRDFLPPTIWQSLGVGVLISGAYYLAASAVFPEHPEQFDDLDSYYWLHKREVFGIILACSLAVQVIGLARGWSLTPIAVAINLPVFTGMAVGCFSRNRLVDLIVLGSVIAVLTANLAIP